MKTSWGPVVKTSPSNVWDADSVPGQKAVIPHASWTKIQNIKQKQYCNKFNEDYKWSTSKNKFFKKKRTNWCLMEHTRVKEN